MTKLHQIYKCSVCGNIVDVVHTGGGELVCCGKPMVLQVENTVDASLEKHVPVTEVLPADVCRGVDGIKVKIGAEEHPMTEDHFIEWIEIEIEDGRTGRKYLKPGDKPEVVFQTRQKAVSVRAYCNLHGLWKKDIE